MVLCSSLIGVVSPANAYTGQELAKGAKINISDARKAALKAHLGKIVDQELEKESGGSGLRYSFDIKNGVNTFEVGVDARLTNDLCNCVPLTNKSANSPFWGLHKKPQYRT